MEERYEFEIGGIVYSIDKTEYEEQFRAGNTEQVILNGKLYMVDKEDYTTIMNIIEELGRLGLEKIPEFLLKK